MAGFLSGSRPSTADPRDPPTLEAAVTNWKAGDSIYFGHRKDAARGRDTRRRRRPAACIDR
jgi:hypothetical protein